MADRKRRSDDDRFLGTHFTSTGELSVNENIRGAGPDTLKHVLVEHLLEGETVTRALKRLRPASKQVGNKKRRQIGGSQRQRYVLQVPAALFVELTHAGILRSAHAAGQPMQQWRRMHFFRSWKVSEPILL